MKSAWPHLLNLLLIIFIILLFTGVIDTRTPVKPTDQILGYMNQTNAKASLVIGADGSVTAINGAGKPMPQCSVAPSDKIKRCEGTGPKGEAISSKMFNIFSVHGSSCIEIIGGDGIAYEYCW